MRGLSDALATTSVDVDGRPLMLVLQAASHEALRLRVAVRLCSSAPTSGRSRTQAGANRRPMGQCHWSTGHPSASGVGGAGQRAA